MPEFLTVEGLSAGYDKRTVLRDVELEAQRGTVTTVIGHNGAGKTTLLHTIFGLVPWATGRVFFRGANVSNAHPAKRLELGMVLVPQGVNVFGDLTIQEHLDLVAKGENPERAFSVFPVLRDRRFQKAGTLSGGERQMLAVGCAILRNPELMLIDEPSGGLAPIVVGRLMETLASLRDNLGMTIVLVEQNVAAAIEIADAVYAMREGVIIYSGNGGETRRMSLQDLWELL